MPLTPEDCLIPDWPAPAGVHALVTTRRGGVSTGPWASLNLGTAVGDDPEAVATNRTLLAALLPGPARWLRQVHGNRVVAAEDVVAPEEADASVTTRDGVVCAVQMADCLPVLFASVDGSRVAAAHAGWRGLAGGVLENTVAALGCAPAGIMAWLGPAIGPHCFEVGEEVLEAFVARDPGASVCFAPQGPGKWLADLPGLARQRLRAAGVTSVHGGALCTHSDPERFFSHRRDRITGRMAALVWRSPLATGFSRTAPRG
jgi:YfiH family protein